MKIKIKDKELELVSPLSGRTHIMYENVVHEPLDYTKLKDITTITTLLFATICATLQKNHLPLDITYEDFLDWMDDEKDLQPISEFVIWIVDLLGIQDLLAEENKELEGIEEKKTED